jgi:lysophospholipase L1-like esterase
VKGQVTPNEVAMLGDSYMDPLNGGVGPAIMTAAGNKMYRAYYHSAAAMNYGSGILNIPYQFETSALMDTLVQNPTDIKVVIMDGGGNDVLIDNNTCLTKAPPDATCSMAIDASVARAKTLLQEMATKGVQHIVYFYYPHLDPNGGGLLGTTAPDVNLWLDYALPGAEDSCCGTHFMSTAQNYSCRGNGPGTDCVMIDTIPAFTGHLTDYIQSDHVHPTAAGAKVIADLVWKAMVDNCIAQ